MLSGAEVRARLAALPLFVLVLPWRCSLVVLPQDGGVEAPSAVHAKEEVATGRVQSAPPHAPTVKVTTLPEEVVLKVIRAGQGAFLSCWARAQRIDPVLSSTKVRLHVELDGSGKVILAQTDSDSPTLSTCLANVAHKLPFPAPGALAVVDLPLMF
jgi:hypothetical protein